MASLQQDDVYSAREIARAAGLTEAQVLAALGGQDGFIRHDDAVRLARELMAENRQPFTVVSSNAPVARGVPLAVSSTVHAGLVAGAILVAAFGASPAGRSVVAQAETPEDMRLVFITTPGPGGGGGGGGTKNPLPAPKALREGHRALSSPMPERVPPKPVEPAPAPPEPKPMPIDAEPLPVVVAPIVTAPADDRNRAGVLQQARTEQDSHGPGEGGGAGTGKGTGLGEGDGSGVGPGSGGGTGGGPYRPGSGIEAPRLLREVKADYTEAARRSN